MLLSSFVWVCETVCLGDLWNECQSLKEALFDVWVRRTQDICVFWCTHSQHKPLKTLQRFQQSLWYRQDLRLNLNISDPLILFCSISYCFMPQMRIFVHYLHTPLPFCFQSVPFTSAHVSPRGCGVFNLSCYWSGL